MAVFGTGKYHLSNTARGFAPALVLAQYDATGGVVADGGATSGVDTVDVLLLGYANGHRTDVSVGTADNEFEFGAGSVVT